MNNFVKSLSAKSVKIILLIFWILLFAATTFPGKPGFKVGVHDKIAHFAGYFILSFLFYWYLLLKNKFNWDEKKIYLYSIIILFSYAIFDEIHQIFIPGRSFELFDLFADLLGLLCGTFLSKYILSRLKISTRN